MRSTPPNRSATAAASTGSTPRPKRRAPRTRRGGASAATDVPRLVLNGETVALAGIRPTMTLLDWLRDVRGLKGTKEGCAEGDCGACTVVLEGPGGWRAINACLAMVGQLDGVGVRTI